MGRKGRKRLYQFVDDLVAIGARDLVAQARMAEPQARELMTSIAYALCDQYARTNFYVPAVMERPLTKRDEDMWREYGAAVFGADGSRPFTAERITELAAAHGISERQVYSVLALMRRREQDRLQVKLPGFEEVEA